MPIYGKLSKARARKSIAKGELEGKIISRQKLLRRENTMRVLETQNEQHWLYHNTSLKKMQSLLGINLTDLVSKRITTKPKQKPVVVDWGCSNGTAIRTLAKKFEGKAECYGVSHRTYPEWKTNRDSKKVKFVHSTANDFFRYFKDGSIDLFYAHQALLHLPNEVEYIQRVLPKLATGGKLVANLDLFNLGKYQEYTKDKMPIRMGKSIFKVESNGRAIVITRIG